MDDKQLKPNLRSIYFTDDFRQKLDKGIAAIAELRQLGIRVLRTNYEGPRPILEIDPATAKRMDEIPSGMIARSTGDGAARRNSKLVSGCEVVWTANAA